MDTLKHRADRIIKLLELTGTDACVVKSAENRRYITGLYTSAGMVVVTRMGNRYVVVDDRYEEIALKQLAPQGFVVKITLNRDNYTEIMNDIVQSDRVSAMLLESDTISHGEYLAFENGMYSKVMPLRTQLSRIRAVKDTAEVESIKTAQRISEKAFEETLEYIKPGMTEKQVQAKLVQCLLENGSEMGNFHICCVAGGNSSLVHGAATDRKIQAGDPILFDFGAFYNGYRSSMSRTVSVGKPEEEFLKVYNIVKNAGVLGLKYLKAGESAADVDEEVRSYIEQMGFGGNYRHGTGHGIGIDYHEMPTINTKSTDILEVGNTAVIEPGIYLKGRFGVRIGDMYYLGEKGRECLTKTTRDLIVI